MSASQRIGSGARRTRSRATGLILIASLACGCATPAPRAEVSTEMRVVTVPAGARCETLDGEVYVTPAVIPSPPGSVLQLQVEKEGHEPRRVALFTRPDQPRLSMLVLGDFFEAFTGAGCERVDVSEGRVFLALQPLDVDDSTARPAVAPMAGSPGDPSESVDSE